MSFLFRTSKPLYFNGVSYFWLSFAYKTQLLSGLLFIVTHENAHRCRWWLKTERHNPNCDIILNSECMDQFLLTFLTLRNARVYISVGVRRGGGKNFCRFVLVWFTSKYKLHEQLKFNNNNKNINTNINIILILIYNIRGRVGQLVLVSLYSKCLCNCRLSHGIWWGGSGPGQRNSWGPEGVRLQPGLGHEGFEKPTLRACHGTLFLLNL